MSDRRMTGRRDGEDAPNEDRRKIPRFTNSEFNRSLEQIKLWAHILYGLSIVIAVFELGYALSRGMENLTQGLFFGTIFLIMAILLWRTVYTLKLFLKNHSISNLQRVTEQLSIVFAYIAFLGVTSYITSFFFRF